MKIEIVSVVLVLSGAVVLAPAPAAAVLAPAPAAAGPGARAWLGLGDSYSSGEGISGTTPPLDGQGDCARATGENTNATAWAVGAYQQVKDELGLSGLTFVACTGAINDDIQEQIREAGSMNVPYVNDWDIVTFSSGGNNLGFVPVLMRCMDLYEPWQWGVFARSPGCETSEEELRRRVDIMAGRIEFSSEGVEGEVTWPQLYRQVAEHVEPGGDVVVAGYPQLFEDPAKVPPYLSGSRSCETVLVSDIPMLRRVLTYVNESIRQVVEEADRNADNRRRGVRFHYFDPATLVYEVGDGWQERHGLCSADPYLNGITTGVTSGDWRTDRSFHPNQRGHDATATALAEFARSNVRFDDAPQPTGEVLDDVDWPSVVQGRVDCSGIDADGLVELDGQPARFDINADGAIDAVVAYQCYTGNSSAFVRVEVFDGASPDGEAPRSLGVVVETPDAETFEEAIQTGLGRISYIGFETAPEDEPGASPSVLVLEGSMWAPNDSNACPSLVGRQRAQWSGTALVLQSREVFSSNSC